MERGCSRIINLIPLFFLIFFLFYPVSRVLIDAFFEDNVFTLGNFPKVLFDPLTRKVIVFTLVQAFLSTFFSSLIGYPLGFIISRYNFPGKSALRSLLLLPFMMPSTTVVLGFMLLYGPKGLFSSIIPQLKVLGEGFYAIIAAHVFYNVPLVSYYVSTSLSRIDPEIEEASDVLGTSPLLKFLKIFLPQTLPGVLSASLLVFLYCFSSFTIPLILGGVKFRTLEVEIYSFYKIFLDHNSAATLSVIQLTILILISILYIKYVVLKTEEIEPGSGEKTRELNIKEVSLFVKLLILGYMMILSIYLFSPIFSVIMYSLVDLYTGKISLSPFLNVLSPKYNPYLGTSPLYSVINTLLFSGIASLLSVSISFLAVIDEKATGAYSVLFNIPLMVSSITLALSLHRTYGLHEALYSNSWVLITLSYAVMSLPLTYRIIRISLSRIPREIIEAAETLGSSEADLITRIKIPLAIEGVFSAFLLSLAVGMSEFATTLFLAKPEYTTMTVAMYRFISSRRFQEASAMGSLLLITSSFIFYLSHKLKGMNIWSF